MSPSRVSEIDAEARRYLIERAPHREEAVRALAADAPIWGMVDSLLVLGLVVHLEKTFGFKARPTDFTPANLSSLAALARFVEAKLGGAES